MSGFNSGRMRIIANLFTLTVSITLCAADSSNGNGNTQSTLMDRPVLGYAAQSAPLEVRAILGVPGAAVFSDPLTLPRDVTRVRIAPGQSYALLERLHQEPAVLLLSGTAAGPIAAIPGALRAADLVAFSPSGRSAVLVSKPGGRVQMLTGLPETPRVSGNLDLQVLPEMPEDAAISDDAGSVLFAAGGSVYLLSPDGSTRLVVNAPHGASLAFFPNSMDGAIGDRSTGSVYLFQHRANEIALPLLTTNLAGLAEISSGADAQKLYITNPGARLIWSVDITTGQAQTTSLSVIPGTLRRLRNSDSFLISSEPREPAWILFRQGNDARTVFVPTATPSGQEDRSIRPRD